MNQRLPYTWQPFFFPLEGFVLFWTVRIIASIFSNSLMQRPGVYSLITTLLLLLTSCQPNWQDDGWSSQGVPGEWKLEVPAGLISEMKLNRDAVLQLHSPTQDFFVLVRKDSLATLTATHPDFTLEDFLDLSIERLIQNLSEPEVPEASPATINGSPAHRASIHGRYKSDPIRYELALIEGQEFMYQVLLWIPEKMSEQYSPLMEQVIESVRIDK